MLPALCQPGPLLRGGDTRGPGLVQTLTQRLGDAPGPTTARMLIQRLGDARGPGPVQTLIQRLADAPSPASAWTLSASWRMIPVLCQPRPLPRSWGMPRHGAEHTNRVFFPYFSRIWTIWRARGKLSGGGGTRLSPTCLLHHPLLFSCSRQKTAPWGTS